MDGNTELMKEMFADMAKTWAATGGVVAAAWLSNINEAITTLILLCTFLWSAVRVATAWVEYQNKKKGK